jgi:hypothetical protein
VVHCQYHSLDLEHLKFSTQAAQALSPHTVPAGQLLLPPHCAQPGLAAPEGWGWGTGTGCGVGWGTGAGVPGLVGAALDAPGLHCQYHSLVRWQVVPLAQAAHALSPQMAPGGQALLPPHCCHTLTVAAAGRGVQG